MIRSLDSVQLSHCRRSFSCGRSWILFYLFSRHHGLDDSVEFLADCAMREDWLTLVVFAELFQCSPSKVLPLVVCSFSQEVACGLWEELVDWACWSSGSCVGEPLMSGILSVASQLVDQVLWLALNSLEHFGAVGWVTGRLATRPI